MTTAIDWIAAILGLCSLGTGVFAAWLWWRASKVAVAPAWPLQIGDNIDSNIMAHVMGQLIAFKDAGGLNAKAALWTAIAVLSGSLGSLAPFASKIVDGVRSHF